MKKWLPIAAVLLLTLVGCNTEHSSQSVTSPKVVPSTTTVDQFVTDRKLEVIDRKSTTDGTILLYKNGTEIGTYGLYLDPNGELQQAHNWTEVSSVSAYPVHLLTGEGTQAHLYLVLLEPQLQEQTTAVRTTFSTGEVTTTLQQGQTGCIIFPDQADAKNKVEQVVILNSQGQSIFSKTF